jgi:hypothetical protein
MIADEFRAGRLSAHITHTIFNTVRDLIDYELAREQLFRASARIAVASNRVSTWIRRVITNLGVYGGPSGSK